MNVQGFSKSAGRIVRAVQAAVGEPQRKKLGGGWALGKVEEMGE